MKELYIKYIIGLAASIIHITFIITVEDHFTILYTTILLTMIAILFTWNAINIISLDTIEHLYTWTMTGVGLILLIIVELFSINSILYDITVLFAGLLVIGSMLLEATFIDRANNK